MNCRWSTVYTFPSSLERLELRCDVVTLGQDTEKAAPLGMFIDWVRASLTCTLGRINVKVLEAEGYRTSLSHRPTAHRNVCYVY